MRRLLFAGAVAVPDRAVISGRVLLARLVPGPDERRGRCETDVASPRDGSRRSGGPTVDAEADAERGPVLSRPTPGPSSTAWTSTASTPRPSVSAPDEADAGDRRRHLRVSTELAVRAASTAEGSSGRYDVELSRSSRRPRTLEFDVHARPPLGSVGHAAGHQLSTMTRRRRGSRCNVLVSPNGDFQVQEYFELADGGNGSTVTRPSRSTAARTREHGTTSCCR